MGSSSVFATSKAVLGGSSFRFDEEGNKVEVDFEAVTKVTLWKNAVGTRQCKEIKFSAEEEEQEARFRQERFSTRKKFGKERWICLPFFGLLSNFKEVICSTSSTLSRTLNRVCRSGILFVSGRTLTSLDLVFFPILCRMCVNVSALIRTVTRVFSALDPSVSSRTAASLDLRVSIPVLTSSDTDMCVSALSGMKNKVNGIGCRASVFVSWTSVCSVDHVMFF